MDDPLLCWPEFSPQMVGTRAWTRAGDPATLKASVEQAPPARTVVPLGPTKVKVSKSSRMEQMSRKKSYVNRH